MARLTSYCHLRPVLYCTFILFVYLSLVSTWHSPFLLFSPKWCMEELLALANHGVPKNEFISALTNQPSTVLFNLRTCLFEEAREKDLTHPTDVLVTRRCSPIRPITFIHAEDIWNIAISLSNSQKIPPPHPCQEWQM